MGVGDRLLLCARPVWSDVFFPLLLMRNKICVFNPLTASTQDRLDDMFNELRSCTIVGMPSTCFSSDREVYRRGTRTHFVIDFPRKLGQKRPAGVAIAFSEAEDQ